MKTLRVALRDLGRDDEAVRRSLRRRRIRFGAKTVAECPVTQYLRRLGYRRVIVSRKTAMAIDRDGAIAEESIPWAVQGFIDAWDSET